jgi:hypothetical protein
MARKKNEFTELARQMYSELEGDAKAIAPALEVLASTPDQQQLTRAQYLDFVADSWFRDSLDAETGDQGEAFRHSLLVRMGADQFMALAKEVVPKAIEKQAAEMAAMQQAMAPPPIDPMALLMGAAPPALPGMPPGQPPMPMPQMTPGPNPIPGMGMPGMPEMGGMSAG